MMKQDLRKSVQLPRVSLSKEQIKTYLNVTNRNNYNKRNAVEHGAADRTSRRED